MPISKKFCFENKKMRELFRMERAGLLTYSRRQDKELLNTYELLRRRDDLRMIVIDLACGHQWIDEETKGRIYTWKHMAAIAGKEETHFKSGEALRLIKEHFIHDLSWQTYDFSNNKARIIHSCTIPERINKIINAPEFEEDRIFVKSRLKASEKKIIEADKKMLPMLKDIQRPYWQLDYFAECMHSTPIEIYLNLRKKNGIATIKAAKAMGDPQQVALAKGMYDRPRPYAMETITENDLLARLYVTEHGTIHRSLRRTFYKGCPELDIQNAHFSFLAMKYPRFMPETVKFLTESLKTEGLSIWNMVLDHLHIEEDKKAEVRELVKPATYSIQYGRESKYAQTLLYEQLRGTFFWKGRYLDCIYIKELATATKQCMSDIEKYGGMQNAFGFQQWDRSKMDIKSFMANSFQTYEIALMYPIYKLFAEQKAMNKQMFHILLHQHDGLTSQFLEGYEDIAFMLMTERFNKVRDDYGIITCLTKK